MLIIASHINLSAACRLSLAAHLKAAGARASWQLKIGSSQGPSGPTAHHSTFSHSSTHSSDVGISEKAAGGKDLAGRNKPIQVGPHVQLVVFPWISLYLFLGKIWQNQWEYNTNVTNNMAGSITNHSPEKCVYFGIASPISPNPIPILLVIS